MNYLWLRLFWRAITRIGAAGLILGGVYFPIIFTIVLIFNLLFHASDYHNLGATLIVYVLAVVFGGIYGGIFGAILGLILGIMQASMLFVALRFFVHHPYFQQILSISSGAISLVITSIYFSDFFPGMPGVMLIIPLILTIITNVWIVRKIGVWYLSEAALPPAEKFERADAGDEP